MSGVCEAQKQVEHQHQVWFAYNNKLTFNPTWSLVTEVQERRFVNPDAQYQFLIRTHLHRDLGAGWDVATGIAYFLQSPNHPESHIQFTVPEIRPHLEFNLRQKIKALSIEHRYKIEMRFFHNINADLIELEDGFTYGNLRFRYRLQLVIPIIKFNEAQSMKIKVGDEVMLNVGQKIVNNLFDQNRLFVGLNMTFSPSITVETGYINYYQQQKSGINYYNRDIFGLIFYHSIQTMRTL
jgi:hypothetical protein